VFVPSFYAVMDDLSKGTGWLFGRFFSKPEDESAWEPMQDFGHATPGEASAKAMMREPMPPPRLAAE
jgi:hypothetical protein